MEESKKKGLDFTARKDHAIHQNETHIIFKKGEKYTDIDRKWKDTLKAEKVI